MKLDYSSLRPCDQAPLIAAKRELFPHATCLRFCNGKVENYAETRNYYLDHPNQNEWTREDCRVFVFSYAVGEWFELEYDAHFHRRREEDGHYDRRRRCHQGNGVPSIPSMPSAPSIPSIPSIPAAPSIPGAPAVPSAPAAPAVPSAPAVPWWNRHYTLPTNGLENTFFAVKHVTPDNYWAEIGILWHEHNATINAQRQHDLIALRRFIRGAICGQEGTE